MGENEIRRTRRTVHPAVPVSTERKNRIVLTPAEVVILEVEDVLFHSDSAVVLPAAPKEEATSRNARSSSRPGGGVLDSTMAHRLEGLDVFYTVYRYLEKNPDKHVVIAGHADTSGQASYNFEISDLRANGVKHLLLGEREPWANICAKKQRVEDVQQVLTHFHEVFLFGCDPGPIDNKLGDRTKKALGSFRRGFEAIKESLGLRDSPSLPDHGFAGEGLRKEYWGAVFDLYQWELSAMLGCSPDDSGLGPWRKLVHFVDPAKPIVACGESFPIAAPEKRNFRSQENRRVEILFFYPEHEPKLGCPAARGTVHTEAECPIYKKSIFRRTYLQPERKTFVPWMDLQTVDGFGQGVPDFDLVLKLSDGSERSVRSDSTGFVRTFAIPVGPVRIAFPDGRPVRFFGAGEEEAVVAARPENLGIVSLLVREGRAKGRDAKVVRTPETQSEGVGTRTPDPAASAQIDWVQVANSMRGEMDAAMPQESNPSTRAMLMAADNLALAAGWKGDELDVDRLVQQVIPSWLECRYPEAIARGYRLLLIRGNSLLIREGSGEWLGEFALARRPEGLFGAYVAVEREDGWPVFVDMERHRYSLGAEGVTDGLFPLSDLVRADQRDALYELLMHDALKIRILYHAPTAGQLVWMGVFGGTGLLEDYARNGHDGHVHERNKVVVKTVVQGYEAYLDSYIRKVKATESEDELRALGPPRQPYFFPMPIGASEAQARELANLNETHSLRAWRTIADHICYLAGTFPPGFYFLVKLKAKMGQKPKIKGLPLAPFYEGVDVEWNFDFGNRKQWIPRKIKAKASGGIGGNPITEIPPGVATIPGVGDSDVLEIPTVRVETSMDAITGKPSWAVEVGWQSAKLKVENSGKIEVSLPVSEKGSAFATVDPEHSRMGFGYSHKISDYFDLQVGITYQGITEEIVEGVLSDGPGFFERRSLRALLSPNTRWVDLNLDEIANLEALGWSEAQWEDKRGQPLRVPHFPRSAATAFKDLNYKEHVAAFNLGFRKDNWSASWREIASPGS